MRPPMRLSLASRMKTSCPAALSSDPATSPAMPAPMMSTRRRSVSSRKCGSPFSMIWRYWLVMEFPSWSTWRISRASLSRTSVIIGLLPATRGRCRRWNTHGIERPPLQCERRNFVIRNRRVARQLLVDDRIEIRPTITHTDLERPLAFLAGADIVALLQDPAAPASLRSRVPRDSRRCSPTRPRRTADTRHERSAAHPDHSPPQSVGVTLHLG